MYLYFIVNRESKFFKIGKTKDLPNRLNQIQNATGCDISLIAHAIGDKKLIESAELMCLALFGKNRTHGEWAKFTNPVNITEPIKSVFKMLEENGCEISFDVEPLFYLFPLNKG